MKYTPQVDDYVRWKNNEGWVYFKCDESLSIEIGVKDKVCSLGTRHKKDHTLLVCYNFQWHELEYVKNRRENNIDEYKSQQYRHKDPWIRYGKYGSMPSEVSVMTKQNLTIIMLLAYAPLYLLVTWSLTLLLYLEYWGIGMMYQVNYMKPKKKGYAKQTATFVKIDDAVFWEKVMTEQGCTDFQILVK